MHLLKERLEAYGYKVKTPKRGQLDKILEDTDVKYIIDLTDNCRFSLRYKKLYKGKLIVFIWEPPTVKPELYQQNFHDYLAKIFTVDDLLVDNKKYFKLVYPCFRPKISLKPLDFKKKKGYVLINANKTSNHPYELYSARKDVINFFEKQYLQQLDLYGKGWDVRLKSYRGKIPWSAKWKCLSQYRFCVCYENITNIYGYVTEKIFDCFEAGCVPIYWGASNITDYIPKGCFVDRRDFNTMQDLYIYLKNVSQEAYNDYLKNIKAYLQSEKIKLFTYESLFENIFEAFLI